ncbi:MAG TPA: hypothetical protein VHY91_19225 [Pirellulales bacterium]|jgi:hypothetical protein|nr:hypothetical protein [Pirellulales bacterium]
MKPNRRAIGWSVGLVAVAAIAAGLAWERCPGGCSTRTETGVQVDAGAAVAADMSEPSAADDATGAEISPQVDFSGSWQLNVEASDSLDPILEAIGLSFIERALVNNTVVTHVIRQTADELTIDVQTSFFSRTDHLPLNGQPADTLDPSGRPVESVSAWSDDGRRLISKIWVKPDKQRFTLTRSMDEEHDAMEVLIEFFPQKGKPMASRRVYRRIVAPAADKSS